MNATGATDLDRTICADAGIAGVIATHGVSPEVDPERWGNARYVVVWAWNPLSTAPHLWRFILEARKRSGAKLVVIDPFRSRTARVADEHLRPTIPGTDGALALGMMRAVVDAGLHDDDWCRAHTTGYDDLLERLQEWPVEKRQATISGIKRPRFVASARSSHRPSPRCCGSGSADSGTPAHRWRIAQSPASRRWPGVGATTGVAALTSRPPRGGHRLGATATGRSAAGAGPHDQHVAAR